VFNVKSLHIAWVADATSVHGGSVNNCPDYMYIFLFFWLVANIFPHLFKYLQPCVVKGIQGKTVLQEGLL